MRVLCAVHFVVVLSALGGGVRSAALNGAAATITTTTTTTTGNNGRPNDGERSELKMVMRNILNKHAANSQLQHLQASLAGVRPAAAILCSDNDIGIEFELNDHMRLPANYPAQNIYTTFEGDGGGGGRLVEAAAANVYCSDESDEGDDLLPQRLSESPQQWDVGAGDGVRHFDYGQIAAPPHVSVHQYGTNYFQHNSYTMPLTATSTTPAPPAAAAATTPSPTEPASESSSEPATVPSSTPLPLLLSPPATSPLAPPPQTPLLSSLPQNGLSIESHGQVAAAQPTTPDLAVPAPTPAANAVTTSENATTPPMVTVAPILAADDDDDSIENIFIIHRNRTKKDKETNKRNTTHALRCQTFVSVNMTGNGKPVNLTSPRPSANGLATVATTTAIPPTTKTQQLPKRAMQRQRQRQRQRILNTEIQGRHNDNVNDTTNADDTAEGVGQFIESQFKANSITTKRSIDYLMSNRYAGDADITPPTDNDDISPATVTESNQDALDEQHPQLEIIAYNANVKAATTSRSPYETTLRPFTSNRSTAQGKLQPTVGRAATPRRHRNRTATAVVLGKGKPRRPAETNYYYYYTKPTPTTRNRPSKPLLVPARPYVEPIAHEALDSEFMAKQSMPLPLPLPLPLARPPSHSNHVKLADHHRKINNLRYVHAIGQRRRPGGDASNIEKCQQHNGDKYILVPHNRDKLIKDIIATEQVQHHRREDNVHYYRELRPFEEPLDGHDCRDDAFDDGDGGQAKSAGSSAPKRKGQSASSRRGQSDNQSDYFMCNDDDPMADEATEASPLGAGARSVLP